MKLETPCIVAHTLQANCQHNGPDRITYLTVKDHIYGGSLVTASQVAQYTHTNYVKLGKHNEPQWLLESRSLSH